MKIIKSYSGYIGNVYAIVCGNIPEGMVIKEEKRVLQPDEGKYLFHNGTLIDGDVVLMDGENQEEYQEIDIPNYTKEKNE